MPALPWIARIEVNPTTTYIAMVSELPLASHRAIPRFLRHTRRIRRQLAAADGLVGYALKADLLHKTFWTYSVWVDQDSLDRFARRDPHRAAPVDLHDVIERSTFVTLVAEWSALPATWPARLAVIRAHRSTPAPR